MYMHIRGLLILCVITLFYNSSYIGTQWSTPTVTVLLVLLFLVVCTNIMVVVVLVAVWFRTGSKV